MNLLLWRRILAVSLILTGGVGLALVFWLLPARCRSLDSEWQAEHSELAWWEETGNRIRRFSWAHDDSGPVGNFGGKEWAEWIMERLPTETDPDECSSGHKVTALRKITNYHPDLSQKIPWREQLPLWLRWWEQNRNRTQEEWIVDGFTALGLSIQNPPAKADWPDLLNVLGQVGHDSGRPDPDGTKEQPYTLRYNAFRCLRDSGFNPVEWATGNDVTPETKSGLLEFYRMVTARRDLPGSLFAAGPSTPHRKVSPWPLDAGFQWGWGGAAFLVAAAGVRLLLPKRKACPNPRS